MFIARINLTNKMYLLKIKGKWNLFSNFQGKLDKKTRKV